MTNNELVLFVTGLTLGSLTTLAVYGHYVLWKNSDNGKG